MRRKDRGRTLEKVLYPIFAVLFCSVAVKTFA